MSVQYDISYGDILYRYKLNQSINIIPTITKPSVDPSFVITINTPLIGSTILDTFTGAITCSLTSSSEVVNNFYTITITDKNTGNTKSAIIQLIIAYEPTFEYIPNELIYTRDGVSIGRITPSIFVPINVVVFFSDITDISNNLSSFGLNIDRLSGDINGILNKIGVFNITIKSDNNNSGIIYTRELKITVLEKPVVCIYDNSDKLNVIFDANKNLFTFAQGEKCRISPQIQAGVSYSISGCTNLINYILPKGLTFNTTNGVISGIPLVFSTYRKYKITAYNINGYPIDTYLYITSLPTSRLSVISSIDVGTEYNYDSGIRMDMRRKIEIFKYEKNGITYTESQQSSIFNKRQQHLTNRTCPRRQPYIASETSACGVPGKPMFLFYDPTVRIYNLAQMIYTPSNLV